MDGQIYISSADRRVIDARPRDFRAQEAYSREITYAHQQRNTV